MTTQEGENTHVYAIDGNFDDAQAGVKKIFNDPEFAKELDAMNCKLSSANSINIGRLVPQVAYYVYGYGQLVEQGVIKAGDPINVVVPTGNFGNILAAYYAGQMGLPINRYICASNENNILTDFINTGVYDLHRDFFLTNSPSMDILISSNLERLLFFMSGNDGEMVKDLMERMETEKSYEVSPGMRLAMASFYGGFADMEATGETIGKMYRANNYLMDTHTAVAYRVYENYRAETGDTMPTLIASTASAYKFADSVADAIGIGRGDDGFASVRAIHAATGVPIPSGLMGLEDKPILHNNVVKAIHMDDAVKTALSRR
jgi:threonine synthase